MLKSMSRHLTLLSFIAGLTACAPYSLETPAGFVEVNKSPAEVHYKAADNVGLSLKRFENVEGGTFDYWEKDLLTKLSARGYTLTAQQEVDSKNGVHGKRFDFDYVREDQPAKFYTAVLFVTDAQKLVVQLAGNKDLAEAHRKQLPEILQDLRVGGCKTGSDICK